MYLSEYNFAHIPYLVWVLLALLAYFLVQFVAPRRWLGFTAGTYSSCVIHFHHHVFSISIRMYVLAFPPAAGGSPLLSAGVAVL